MVFGCVGQQWVPPEDEAVASGVEVPFPFKITLSETPSNVCPGMLRADVVTGDILALSIARVVENNSCTACDLTYTIPEDADNLVDMIVSGRGPALSFNLKDTYEYSGVCVPANRSLRFLKQVRCLMCLLAGDFPRFVSDRVFAGST